MAKHFTERFIGIIPARYGSTRLNGKPLLEIEGKPMIQHVYEKAVQALPHVYVATDDPRIITAVEGFGGKALLTSQDHTTGSSRCLEAAERLIEEQGHFFDVLINIQGDEPLLVPAQIEELMGCYREETPEISTLVIRVTDPKELVDENGAFVVVDKNMYALYFSRAVLPYRRGIPKNKWLEHGTYYKQVGMYGYTMEALRHFSSLPHSSLEESEMLEQNRWLEDGRKIKIGLSQFESLPVDTPSDLEKIRKLARERK